MFGTQRILILASLLFACGGKPKQPVVSPVATSAPATPMPPAGSGLRFESERVHLYLERLGSSS
jgi:hypothetical protein